MMKAWTVGELVAELLTLDQTLPVRINEGDDIFGVSPSQVVKMGRRGLVAEDYMSAVCIES